MKFQKGQIVTVLTLIALGVMSVGALIGAKVVQKPSPPFESSAAADIFPEVPSNEFQEYTGTVPRNWGNPWIAVTRKCNPSGYYFNVTVCRDLPERGGFRMEFYPPPVIVPAWRDWYAQNFYPGLVHSSGGNNSDVHFEPYEFGKPENDCATVALKVVLDERFCDPNNEDGKKAVALVLRPCTPGFGCTHPQYIIFGALPSEVTPTPTITPTTPDCPYDADAYICVDNNSNGECEIITQVGFSTDYLKHDGTVGNVAFGNDGVIPVHISNLSREGLPFNAWVKLNMPPDWEINGTYCKANNDKSSCPANAGQAVEKLDSFLVACGADYDYGWILNYTGTVTPTPTTTPHPTNTPAPGGKTYQLDWHLGDGQGICWVTWADSECGLLSHEGGDLQICSQGDGSDHNTTITNKTGNDLDVSCDKYTCNSCTAHPPENTHAECTDNRQSVATYNNLPDGCSITCNWNGISEPDCPPPGATNTPVPPTPTPIPGCIEKNCQDVVYSWLDKIYYDKWDESMQGYRNYSNSACTQSIVLDEYCTATPTATPTPGSELGFDCPTGQECSSIYTCPSEKQHDRGCSGDGWSVCCDEDEHITSCAQQTECVGSCKYSQGPDECYQGSCCDVTKTCGFNDNCGYVAGCPSAGAPVTCPGAGTGISPKAITKTMADQAGNGDGELNARDLDIVVKNYGNSTGKGTNGDLNQDEVANALDFSIYLMLLNR